MNLIEGKGVSDGIVSGPVRFLKRKTVSYGQRTAGSPEEEMKRFLEARADAISQLKALKETAEKENPEAAELLDAHMQMAEDPELCEGIRMQIEAESLSAETAVEAVCEQYAAIFEMMDDEFMRARGADLRDIRDRILRILTGSEEASVNEDVPFILAADDLSPSETLGLPKEKLLGIITAGGSASGHTAILARSMGIPAVIGAGEALWKAEEGEEAILNGSRGCLILSPDAAEKEVFFLKAEAEALERKLQEQMIGLPDISKDGRELKIFCNIGSPEDLKAVHKNDGSGIGLFRSEFLYLAEAELPSEEKQFQAYRTVLAGMKEKPVIIRTMDIGADKKASYLALPEEENPALGMRALRLSLYRPEIFKTQLRALYRASKYGNLSIMFPMVANVWELTEAKKYCEEVKAELMAEGIPFREDVPLGVMIETPAAALISDLLAEEADFFSIGTNDLTQYTLACDRMNHAVERHADPRHEAVKRLIRMTAENAKRKAIPVGICGEVGADPEMIEFYLEAGINEISVNPGAVLPLRKKLRGTEVKHGRR